MHPSCVCGKQVKSGAVSAQHDLASIATNATRGRTTRDRLEWCADSRHLLIAGKLVFDSQDGKSVFDVPSSSLHPVRVVAGDQLAVYNDGSLVNVDLSEIMKAAAAPAPMPESTTPTERWPM